MNSLQSTLQLYFESITFLVIETISFFFFFSCEDFEEYHNSYNCQEYWKSRAYPIWSCFYGLLYNKKSRLFANRAEAVISNMRLLKLAIKDLTSLT